jgi:hypothetical protein
MKTAAIQSTVAIALVGALASPVALSTHTPMRGEGKTTLAQYCMPPSDIPDTHRLYCRLSGAEHGRP